MNAYDVAVIGGGPGGYVAAIRAAKLGLSVVLIEGSELGGTCLNRGCIPTKTLLNAAGMVETVRKAVEWGIGSDSITLEWSQMVAKQEKVVATLRGGIAGLLKANKVSHIRGWAKVVSAGVIEVSGTMGAETKVTSSKIILANGSKPFVPPIEGLEDVTYHTSDTIFDLDRIPNSLTIIGGGVIGVEFAAMFSALGTKVTVIEAAGRIVPMEDEAASRELAKALKKRNVTLLTGAKVTAAQPEAERAAVKVEQAGGTSVIASDILLVAVGRQPNLSGLDALPLAMDGRFVQVNEHLETSIPNIYAVGDLIGGWQLAHVASAEGLVAAANASGRQEKIDYKVVPRCIYTHPEIASVGLTEAEARDRGLQVKVEIYSLQGNGKALSMDETGGFVKLVADEKYGEIIGVTMVGPHVTEMITTASAFIHLEGTVHEWANLIHPHPTVSESLNEAANGWLGLSVNH
ncbi:acetoin dehydrogenase [Paenibacillus darwinianus]|uniref:Dihydrolipoyl dehydrogenase n=1 Tax=Paenibacillus darwinianus TaxID=1380763 RepID=A0A9W5S2Q2_9BACL|nr:dihydrolipoyl dehydrogenase [Paenibacillus darwinianus]EXX86917.1 acetoin dehydrogenase [Paenibacillus darwinianus]EXX90664.1 acetoin dehydrogenase [Paenibacillus darwinianus]EXX91622.1 acetoin dehydrogenase [Paenibacillus darwinianus]